ncbi:unnamed protein product [Taenia asiatica]|uniref:Uncharacterized protein n=1 Tax=Taenia asiatica TaxID=60517 RepID=A0A3P6RAY3_TAEAS|nr:unnamed protein product [Taenia asiatica]
MRQWCIHHNDDDDQHDDDECREPLMDDISNWYQGFLRNDQGFCLKSLWQLINST